MRPARARKRVLLPLPEGPKRMVQGAVRVAAAAKVRGPWRPWMEKRWWEVGMGTACVKRTAAVVVACGLEAGWWEPGLPQRLKSRGGLGGFGTTEVVPLREADSLVMW